MAIHWQLTQLLHSRNYSKTRPLIINSLIFFFRCTGRLSFIHYSIFSFFYLSVMTRSTIYININKQLKRGKNSFKTPMTKTTAITEYRAMSICLRRSSNYGSPPWNTGAALRFLSLRRDFLQNCWWSKVALKLISSTRRCC